MWHEGVGTKGSSELSTCLSKTLSGLKPEVKEVTFYADNASGQNRNSINAAMLRVVHLLLIEIINQKYMEWNSVDSAIENRGYKINIYSPEGWLVHSSSDDKNTILQCGGNELFEFSKF